METEEDRERYRAYMRGWKAKNRERLSAKERARVKKLREESTEYRERVNARTRRPPGYWRLRRYGVTPEEYDAKLQEQGGVCAVCKQDRKLHVDHCHETKKFRGLLCQPCNTGIGKLGDDPTVIKAALDYVIATKKDDDHE